MSDGALESAGAAPGADLWFVTTCMGRLAALKEALPTFVAQPKSRVVVVDYSCPDRAGDWVEAHHPACRVVRVPGQEFFHLSRARNEGFRVVPEDAGWVCFADADVCLSPEFAEWVRGRFAPGRFFLVPMGRGNKGLTGLILASRADVARCGGFDEGYRNYGRQAAAMRVTLYRMGLAPQYLPAGLARHQEHGDDIRAQHYRDKDLVRSTIENSRRLRALIAETERETGEEIPAELCYKESASELRRTLLAPVRGAVRRVKRLWLSR